MSDEKSNTITTDDLVKALSDAGQRESALLLKNWGEMNDVAKLFKSRLEKNAMMGYGNQDVNDVNDVNAVKAEECHEDDPQHEAKEKKKANKIKSKAQELIDMHKKEE